MPLTNQAPCKVRRSQAQEADLPTDGHANRSQNRCLAEQEETFTFDGHSERPGYAISQGERVQLPCTAESQTESG